MQRPCDSNIKQLCLPCIVPVMVLIRFPEDHRIELQTFGQRDRENHHAVMERGTVILFFKQGFFQPLPVVHSGFIADILGNIPHDCKITSGQHLFQHIVDHFAEILRLVDDQLAEFVFCFFQKDSLADQSERRGVIKIQFAFGG